LYHLQEAKDIGSTWPSVSALLQQADVIYGEVLLRGIPTYVLSPNTKYVIVCLDVINE
jgi:hypothetical protein